MHTNTNSPPRAGTARSMFGKTLAGGALLCAALASLPGAAFAADGQTLISQSKALAGNVTPGDAPGFPVTISRSGSYRLSSNLTVSSLHDGIVIAADNVTLDLNGFTISGDGTGNSGNCVDGSGFRRAIAVRNGSLTNCFNAIDLSVSTGVEVHQVRAFRNRSFGIAVGRGANVNGNTVFENAFRGIRAGVDSIVSGNAAFGNADIGIDVVCPSNVVGNSVTGIGSIGVFENGTGCHRANNNPTP